MKKAMFFACLWMFSGCSGGIQKENLEHLNGYWEIEQVIFPNGGTKEYQVNTTIDYIQLDGLKGWRKKVSPKFDGTFRTSDDIEEFVILQRNGNFTIRYKTELSKWSERLTALDTDTFSVVNEDGKQYDYKRFEPISIKK
jgi:hypothetical protein